jgi:hypothetical protein
MLVQPLNIKNKKLRRGNRVFINIPYSLER